MIGNAGTAETPAYTNTFKSKVSLTAEGDVTVNGFNTFSATDPGQGAVTINADGSVTFEGKNAETKLDMSYANVEVKAASSFTMKNVKTNNVVTYVDATLENCTLSTGASKKIKQKWNYTETPGTVTVNLIYPSTANVTEANLKDWFTAPSMNNGTSATDLALANEKAVITFKLGNAKSTYVYSALAGLN